jgi:molecular chaperone GrpE
MKKGGNWMSRNHHNDEEKKAKGPSPVDGPITGNFSSGPSNLGPDPDRYDVSEQTDDAGSLAEQIQQLLAEKQELVNSMARRQADFENFRKRLEKERGQDRQRALESIIDRILPVLDAFDRALAGQTESGAAEYLKGFELIRRQLWDILAKQGLTRIESVGKQFDPHFHHAIEQHPTANHKEGEIIGELQSGYLFQDHVLRPAMVRVAAEPESKSVSVSQAEN